MVLGAVSGIETSSLRSSLGKSKQPRRHRADTCAWSRPGAGAEPLPTRQASARFRPRTMTDSPALHPLHSAAAIRKQRRSAIAAFRRPQTGETVKKRRARPKKRIPEAAMLRISAKTSNSPRCFARARHRNTARGSACRRGQAIWPRGFARPKTSAITVSTAIFRPLHYAGAPFRRSEKWPTSLVKPDWSDTSPSRCVRVCRARPCTHRVAARALRSAVEESDSLASRWRDYAGNNASRPGKVNAGFAALLA